MRDDDKELTEDEINSLFRADCLDNLEECEPDAGTLAKLDALDAIDGFERFWSGMGSSVRSVSELTTPAIPAPAKPEMSEAVTESSSDTPILDPIDVFERVQLRSTKRKAGRFLPGCFGSEFLHDSKSADCGPCKFSEACKKVIADEMPLFVIARKARKVQFTPSDNPKQRALLRGLIRDFHLGKYRKALSKRRQKDRDYQRDKRANPSAEILIEKELRERLAALRSAIARPGKNKLLQQLRGREIMIMGVWEAQQHARLAHGAAASAAQVAKAFNEMVGPDCLSRHQARTYQRHFRSLEQLSHVWKRFVRSPE